MSAHCLVHLWLISDSLLDVYGAHGLVPWAMTRSALLRYVPHLSDIALALGKVGFGATESLYAVLGLYVVGLVGMLVGWRARAAAVAAWCCHLLLTQAGWGLVYGMDFFVHIALSYCVVMPTGGAFSPWRGIAGAPSAGAGITLQMLRLQLAIVYCSSGIEKSLNEQWWSGEAVWRSLTLPVFARLDVAWLAQVPWFAQLAGWGVLAVETFHPLFLYWRRTRAAWLACVVALHVGIGFGMGMGLFAWVMVLLNAVAFGDTSYAWARRRAAQFGSSWRGVRRRLSPGVSYARESTFQAAEAGGGAATPAVCAAQSGELRPG